MEKMNKIISIFCASLLALLMTSCDKNEDMFMSQPKTKEVIKNQKELRAISKKGAQNVVYLENWDGFKLKIRLKNGAVLVGQDYDGKCMIGVIVNWKYSVGSQASFDECMKACNIITTYQAKNKNHAPDQTVMSVKGDKSNQLWRRSNLSGFAILDLIDIDDDYIINQCKRKWKDQKYYTSFPNALATLGRDFLFTTESLGDQASGYQEGLQYIVGSGYSPNSLINYDAAVLEP